MANQEHLDILKQGVKAWNRWREEHSDIEPDLSEINLHELDLYDAILYGANFYKSDLSNIRLWRCYLGSVNLSFANLSKSDITVSELREGNLKEINLSGSEIIMTHFTNADLSGSDLSYTYLAGCDLYGANLSGANFEGAQIGAIIFGNVNLSSAKGLDTVDHGGSSTIGIDTIIRSGGNIPEVFLRGAGVPDSFITYARSLIGKPIDYYTCFISYSDKDRAFAERLYADLQSNGVRCWFAPHDLRPGQRIRHGIDEAIRMYDKLLLILSEYSVASTWVEFEVEAAIDKEKNGGEVLFPVRLDSAVLECAVPWAAHLRRTRYIGDFTHWKQHDEYQQVFSRLLRDLKAEA